MQANVILGLESGEVFTQRNVGNQASHTDLNVMSCLEYAVKELKVKIIICCGHYGCGKQCCGYQTLIERWNVLIDQLRVIEPSNILALFHRS